MSEIAQELLKAGGSLAAALVEEVAAHQAEQARFLILRQSSGQKAIVLVATTDTSVDAVLKFLDAQVEGGIVVIQERCVVEMGIEDAI